MLLRKDPTTSWASHVWRSSFELRLVLPFPNSIPRVQHLSNGSQLLRSHFTVIEHRHGRHGIFVLCLSHRTLWSHTVQTRGAWQSLMSLLNWCWCHAACIPPGPIPHVKTLAMSLCLSGRCWLVSHACVPPETDSARKGPEKLIAYVAPLDHVRLLVQSFQTVHPPALERTVALNSKLCVQS